MAKGSELRRGATGDVHTCEEEESEDVVAEAEESDDVVLGEEERELGETL